MVDGKRAQVFDAEAWPKATSQAAKAEYDSQRPWIVEDNAATLLKHALRAIFVLLLMLAAGQARALERVVMGIPTRIASLDPFSLTGIDTYQATSSILEPLARLNPTTKELIPWLAESWTIDPAHKSFRVKLRPGVKFHNGDMLTADDVKFTFEAYQKPEYKGEIWRAMWEDITAVKVIDPRTVEFQMKTLGYLVFENALTSLRILPHGFYAPYNGAKFAADIAGTGPFRLARFEPNQALELKPFDGWWGAAPPAFQLLIKTVNDSGLAAMMLNKKELDEYVVPSSAEAHKLDPKHVFKANAGLGEGIWIDLNWKRELFQSKPVRKAVLILWDRARVNAKLYGGQFRLALDSFSPKTSYYPEGEPEPYDPKAAVQMLNQAGWSDKEHKGVLKKDGREFRFQILVHDAEQERWVSFFQSDAAKAGIKVEIRRIEEDSQWWKALKDGNFDAVAGGGGMSESPHASTWKSDGYYNFSKYSNAEVDRLIDQLEKEFDLNTRHRLENQIIALIRQDFPQIVGLYSPVQNILLSSRLQLDETFPLQPWRWRLKH